MYGAHVMRSLYAMRRPAVASMALLKLPMHRISHIPSRISFHLCILSTSALSRLPSFRFPPSTAFPRSKFGTDSLGTGASQPRLAIAFTCSVCSTRNHKMFSRRSYEHGVVVIRCDGERLLCATLPLQAKTHMYFFLSQAAGKIT